MIRSEYERAKHDLKSGDFLGLLIRGNYSDYEIEGVLVKIENGRVYLTRGKAHHFSRIITMSKGSLVEGSSQEKSMGS